MCGSLAYIRYKPGEDRRAKSKLEGKEESKSGSEGSEEEGPYLVLNFCVDASYRAAYIARKAAADVDFQVFLLQERLKVIGYSFE